MVKMSKFVLDRMEDIVGKGGNAGYQKIVGKGGNAGYQHFVFSYNVFKSLLP